MKKTIFRSFFVLAIALILSNCVSLHNGYMLNSAALITANFSYVKQNIQGESTATYILGIGGFMKKTLVNDAKQHMLSSFPLKDNQAIVNQTVNFKYSSIFGIVTTVTCTVAADVVEFK